MHHKYSPSKLDRIQACPASAHVDIEETEDDVSEAALSGTRIHAALAGEEPDKPLTDEEQKLVKLCRKYEAMYIDDNCKVLREEELQLVDENFNVITAGTADVIILRENDLILIDWKTGRKRVDASTTQLVAYAAAAMQTFGQKVAQVHIYMPRYDSGQSVIITDFEKARQTVASIVVAAEATSPAFVAGEHCTYCRINASCTACQTLQARSTGVSAELVLRKQHENAVLDPRKVGQMAEQAKVAKKICDQIIAKCKEMTEQGLDTGWVMKEKRGNRCITDPIKAFSENKDLISRDEFFGITTISIAALEALLKTKLEEQWLDKDELKAQIEARIEKVTERGETTQIMVKGK